MCKKICLLCLLSLSMTSFADSADNNIFALNKFKTNLSFGFINGKTIETKTVYHLNSKTAALTVLADINKLNQATWIYSHRRVLKGNIDWKITPWITGSVHGWTTLFGGYGNLSYHGWVRSLTGEHLWSSYGNDPYMALSHASGWDINATGWLFNKNHFHLGIVAGFEQDAFSFKVNSGFHFEEKPSLIVVCPLVNLGINYKQAFQIPYIGVTSLYRYHKFELQASLRASNWGRGTSRDDQDGVIFNSNVMNQKSYSARISVDYHITANTQVYSEGTWNHRLNKEGDFTVNYHPMGRLKQKNYLSAIQHHNMMLMVGLKLVF